MWAYFRKRLIRLLPVFVGVSLLTFLMAQMLPGDIVLSILDDQATPEQIDALRRELGLDRPFAMRYLEWIGNAISGDLGHSFRTSETVLTAILDRLPVSLELMLFAQMWALSIAVPVGILCAVRQGGTFDRVMTGMAFGMLSLPPFLWAIILIFVFAVTLHLLPATGFALFAEDPVGNVVTMLLPSLTLGLAEWPVLMRVLRNDMISTLQEDFIAVAKAKGLSRTRILFVHALKPSSLTLVTVAGINIGRLIGGALIVETIFALPGIGRLLVSAIHTRDFIVVQGVVLFVAAGFVIVNLTVDMLYAILDPRIRHGRT